MTIENERRDGSHIGMDDDAYIHRKIITAIMAWSRFQTY
jgi:hypothetical protein